MWEEVHVVKNNPPRRRKSSSSKKKNPSTKKRGARSMASAKAKRPYADRPKNAGPPSSNYTWRKGVGWVKKGGRKGRRRSTSGSRRRRNPSPRRTTTRRSNPRRTTRRRTTRRRNPTTRRRRTTRRRNPRQAISVSPYGGKFSLTKTFGQITAQTTVGATAGILAASLGPDWLSAQTGIDFTSGWRDPATTLGISLLGGMFLGRFVDKVMGASFAIAGTAVALIKLIRLATSSSGNPLFQKGGVLGSGDLLGDALGQISAGMPMDGGASPYYRYGTTYGAGTAQTGMFQIQD